MSELGTPTFDQLHIFLTVVDAGSFAAAARLVHRGAGGNLAGGLLG